MARASIDVVQGLGEILAFLSNAAEGSSSPRIRAAGRLAGRLSDEATEMAGTARRVATSRHPLLTLIEEGFRRR